ncbi:MAG: NUDIX hydrolase [Propionibacteriaceae bacterium]|nr:NUDIX hydrolase [Propionibacteriaceae bacterium]
MAPVATIFVSTIVIREDAVLMVQESANSHGQRGKWNLPSGHVDVGENLVEAAVREVKEETGYDVTADGLVTVQKADVGETIELVFFFSASLVSDEPSNCKDQMLSVQFVPLANVDALDLRFEDIGRVVHMAEADVLWPLDILGGVPIKHAMVQNVE